MREKVVCEGQGAQPALTPQWFPVSQGKCQGAGMWVSNLKPSPKLRGTIPGMEGVSFWHKSIYGVSRRQVYVGEMSSRLHPVVS